MIVVKLRKPFQTPISFLPERGFMWRGIVAFPGYTQPAEYDSSFDFETGLNQTPTEIGNVYIDNVLYTNTPSEASCAATEKTWYFNPSTQEIFIHLDHTKRMDSSDFDPLQVLGYSSGQVFYDSNNILFEPRVLSNPRITDKVDRFRFQKMSFVPNTLEFDNSKGTFDITFTNPVPGADVNILFISDKDLREGKKTLTPTYTGFVESQKVTDGRYIIKMADKREQLNGKFPNTFFDSTTFPDMETKFIGDLIPEGYGALTGVPAFSVNGTLTSGDVLYKYATDGTVITTVFVLIDDVWTAKTPTAEDAVNCTFTLSAADGRESSGRYRQTKVDCSLRAEENPADIIDDMVFRYLGFQFNSDFYNIAEWGTERALLEDISYYIPKRLPFFELVEPLQSASVLRFIFRPDAMGKFTIKVNDITRAVSKEYQYIDNLNDNRNVDTNFVDYATSVNVGYDKDQESKVSQVEIVDTFKEETLDVYRFEQELNIETLLPGQAEAIEAGEALLTDYKKARDLHTIIIRGIIPQPLLDVLIYDSSVYINGVKIREYAGDVKFKIASYRHDYELEQTILTGYDINDIISKGTSITTQGFMYGDAGYGDGFYYSPTTTYEPEAG